MAIDDRIEIMEDEFKLMKTELKQTLIQVRDFLLSVKLSAPPEDEKPIEIHEEYHVSQPESTTPGADTGSDMPSPTETLEVPLEEPMFQQTEQDIPLPNNPPPPQEMLLPNNPPPPQEMPLPNNPPPPQEMPLPNNPPPPQEMPFENVPLQERPQPDPTPNWQEENSDTYMASAWPQKEAPHKQIEEKSENKEKQPRKNKGDNVAPEESLRSPEVNLIANLICWISDAKSKIGVEQLPNFLNAFGVSGNLSLEMKEFILHQADILEQQPPDITSSNYWSKFITEQLSTFLDIHSITEQITSELKDSIIQFTNAIVQQATAVTSAATSEKNAADVWRQLILELHGVLSYGGVEMVPLKPFSDYFVKEQEQDDTEDKEDKPAKLKLVFPNSKGTDKEFSINLIPEVDTGV